MRWLERVRVGCSSICFPDCVTTATSESSRLRPGCLNAVSRVYSNRSDKDWSLTDCISSAVMDEEGLTEALTADHHFEQAGFVALLLKP